MRVAFLFTTAGDRIVGLDVVADPDRVRAMEIIRSDDPLV